MHDNGCTGPETDPSCVLPKGGYNASVRLRRFGDTARCICDRTGTVNAEQRLRMPATNITGEWTSSGDDTYIVRIAPTNASKSSPSPLNALTVAHTAHAMYAGCWAI